MKLSDQDKMGRENELTKFFQNLDRHNWNGVKWELTDWRMNFVVESLEKFRGGWGIRSTESAREKDGRSNQAYPI
jgi:hypothetical protein